MRTALVTGAAGHLGGAVASALLDRGWRVRGLDRANHWLPELNRHPNFEVIQADVRDASAVSVAVQGADAVFHLAMLLWTGTENPDEVHEIAHRGLENVATAILEQGNTARLVYTSSAAAVGETRDPSRPRTEADWNDQPVTPYTRAKASAERELWSRWADKLDCVSVLPSMVVGPGDPTGTVSNVRLLRMMQTAASPFWFSGGLNVVDVRDAAMGHLLAFEKAPPGRRYLLGGTNLGMQDLLAELRRAKGGSGRPGIRVPNELVLSGVAVVEKTLRFARQKPFVTVEQVRKRLDAYAWVDDSRARSELGYIPRPLSETLRDLVAAERARRAA